jgi:hypothetical protein
MSALSDFIGTERDRYMGEDNNRFAFSLGQVSRYYEFLLIIMERYQQASKELVNNTKEVMEISKKKKDSTLNEKERELFTRNVPLSNLLHLEIESFYLFSKILLDKIAHFLEDYFGKTHGMSLRSHDKLTKYFEKFTTVKGLTVPAKISETILVLKSYVSDYRDKEISHRNNPRSLMVTMFDGKGMTKIARTQFLPNEKDGQIESKELPELMAAIDEYILQVILIVSDNREKSRYKLGRGRESRSA